MTVARHADCTPKHINPIGRTMARRSAGRKGEGFSLLTGLDEELLVRAQPLRASAIALSGGGLR